MAYDRSVDEILTDYLKWLQEKGVQDIDIEEGLDDEILRAAFLKDLIEKCYDEETGFWYFLKFVIGPESRSGDTIWNKFVSSLYKIVKNNRYVALMASRGLGKTKHEDTRITTTGGIKKIKNVQVGDEVISIDDNTYQQRVLKITDKTKRYKKKLYQLETNSGHVCKLSADHPLLTIDGWKKIGDGLKVGDRVGIPREVESYTGTTNDISLARLAGFIISEGSCTAGCSIANSDKQILSNLLFIYNDLFNKKNKLQTAQCGWKINVGNIYKLLPELKGTNSYSKYIPESIFHLDRNSLKEFLKYLFEGDGSVITDGIEYTTMSHQLALDIQLLLQIFGIYAKISKKSVKNGRLSKVGYRITIFGENVFKYQSNIGFVSVRKNKGLKKLVAKLESKKRNTSVDVIPRFGIFNIMNIGDQDNFSREGAKKFINEKKNKDARFINKRHLNLYNELISSDDFKKLELVADGNVFWDEIVKIEDIGEQWCYDIQVGDGTNNYIADGFYSHNSFFFSILYPIYMLWLFEQVEILIVNNTASQIKINFDRLKLIIETNELLDVKKGRKDDITWNNEEIWYNKGKIFARSLGSITRGMHVNLVILDDILRDDGTYSDEFIKRYVQQSVFPTVQKFNGKLILVGTPQSAEDILHYYMTDKEGDVISDGRKSVKGFYSQIFPAVTDEEEKISYMPKWKTWEQLQEIRITMDELSFQKEYQCVCVSDRTALFPSTLLEKVFSRDYEWQDYGSPDGLYYIAADVATSGEASADFSAFVVLEYKEPKAETVFNKKNFKYEVQETSTVEKIVRHIVHVKGMPIKEQVDTLEMLSSRFNSAYVLVERNNVGVALIQEMENRGLNVGSIRSDRQKKEGAIRYLISEMKRGHFFIPYDDGTHEELNSLHKELKGFGIRIRRGKEFMEAVTVKHDDLVDALYWVNLASQSGESSQAYAIIQD